MKGPIYLVGGGKGGVGKSLLAMAIVDYLQDRKEKVLVVDADSTNPDVAKAYMEVCTTISLDNASGWIDLANTCETNMDTTIVINSPARCPIAQHGGILKEAARILGRKLVVLWIISRQRDSLELLRETVNALQPEPNGNINIHVVKNLFFGTSEKFELYNKSKIRSEIEAKGGITVAFPDLADRVADTLYTERLSIAKAMESAPIGNKVELQRWKGEVAAMMAEIEKTL